MAETDGRLNRGLARRRRWATAMLTAEGLLDAFAPALALAGLFLAVSLLGWWSQLPWWLHAAGLVVVAVAVGWTLRRGGRRFRRPEAGDVDRRLETSAGLHHRPIETLADRPAGATDGAAARLWTAHQARQRRALARLRFVGVAPIFSRRDPWALRTAVVLALVVAVVDAGPDWRGRLLDAVTPAPARATVEAPARVDLWVTPPAYTDRAPVVRSFTLPVAGDVAPVVVPERSELVVQHHDPAVDAPTAPRFALEPLATERLGVGSVEARLVLAESGALVVPGAGEDAPRLAVDVEVMPDNPPSVAFDGRPAATQRQALDVRYTAEDDFGLAGIALELTLVGRADTTERIALREISRAERAVEEGRYLDLTPHPFAGQEVTARLVATDVVDQRGVSETLRFTLPERTFTNPLARAIIELRKQLVAQPSERRSVASRLNILAQSPRLDGVEASIPLTLRAASTRLVLHEEGAADRSVVDLLWEVALYVEDGQMAVAERDLRELQEALREALERGAETEELERLMDELQEAMNEFLDAMQRQAMEQMRNMDPRDLQNMQPLDPNARTVDRQDLQEMMEQMRDAMQGGAREQAEQMLARLQQMLENMQTAMQMPQMSPMQQNMNALQELIQRQQQLMDQSFDAQRRQQGQQGQAGQQGQQGQQQGRQGQGQGGQAGAQGLGQQQEALRRALGDLMRQLGERGQDIPRALGQSELQMRGAEQALNQGQPGQATGPQGQALDLLQQGAGQLMEQMQQQMGQQGPGQPGRQPGMGPPLSETRDPLGRPLRNDGGASPYGVEVPERPDLGTAREVLRELQRRSGESERPALELDYLDRLLERF
jgi:uncharacterized protein (TIGR02302 family)